MNSQQKRLEQIKNHIASRFPESSENPSLEEFRQEGKYINPDVLMKHYLGSRYERMVSIWNTMANSPLFHHYDYEIEREEARKRGFQRIAELCSKHPITPEQARKDPESKFDIILGIAEYDQSEGVRVLVHLVLYLSTIEWVGTQKHKNFIEKGYSMQDIGCFAMTELGHGSNVSCVETTATYNHSTREFILNSPTSTSAKWWIGGAAKTANMCVVFAQLYVNQESKGVQVFLVPIRDKNTHEALPGVVLGDCGKKISMDSVDNGFIIFSNYRVPYDSLLDRFSSISPEGKFKSTIKNNEKRLGVVMGGIYGGRIIVVMSAEQNLRIATTVALRFSALRKQFGYSGKEVPILTYQLHKYRLVRQLGRVLASRMANFIINEMYIKILPLGEADPECDEVNEFHAVLSAYKALIGWYSVEGTQACREAVGGLGYSEYSALGRLKGNSDIHATWDGDNSVLIQQTAKYFLKQFQNTLKGKKIKAETIGFLETNYEVVKSFAAEFKSKEGLLNEHTLVKLAEHRVNYLLHTSMVKLQENAANSSEMLEAWNNTQVHHLQEIGKAYGELLIIKRFFDWVRQIKTECSKTASVMQNFAYLFAVDCMEKNLALFQECALSIEQGIMVKETLVNLCENLGYESVKVVDALSPDDRLMHSAIGKRDGQAYKHMINAVESAKNVYAKPSWANLILEMRKGSKL